MAKKSIKNTTFDTSDSKAAFLQAMDLFDDDPTIQKMDIEEEFVPTSSVVWDNVLRLKGIPRGGRVIQIHGKEHGGKSTLCYSIVKSYQSFTDKPVVIFDFESTATPEYLRKVGVNLERGALGLFKPNSVEECIKKTIAFMKAGVKVFVFDSVPRMKSQVDEKDVMSGAAFKATYGSHAKALNAFFDILLPYAQQNDCVLIMVNQIRARIEATNEAMMAAKYPSITNLNYVLPGGYAMKFVPSLTVEVNVQKAFRAGGGEDDFDIEPGDNKGDYVATKVKVRVLKNKVTMGGYREFHLWLRPGYGLDDRISVRELARKYKLIFNKGRKWIVGSEDDPIATYDSKDEAVRDLVIDQNPAVLAKLRQMVVDAINNDSNIAVTSFTQTELANVDASFSNDQTSTVSFDDDEEFS